MNALKARGPDYQKVITMEYNPTEYTDHISTDHISTDHLTVESPSEPFLATMAAAVLSLRGSQICKQPLRTKQVAFCWNGEVRIYRIYRNDLTSTTGEGGRGTPPPPPPRPTPSCPHECVTSAKANKKPFPLPFLTCPFPPVLQPPLHKHLPLPPFSSPPPQSS